MREIIDHIVVLGHQNPDTDASASACAYASLLNRIHRYDQQVIGAVPGTLTPQARYVFALAKKDEPIVVDNVARLVGHVFTNRSTTLSVEQRVGDAIEQLIRCNLSMLPVLDSDNRLHGVFSNRSDAARFLLGFDPTPMWGSLLSIDDLVCMPGMSTLGETNPTNLPDGELRVALDGDKTWATNIHKQDVVVCGSLQTLDDITLSRGPGAVVVVSDCEIRGSQRLARMNSKNIPVLQYDRSIAEFLRGLALQIRLGALSLPTGPSVGVLDRVDDIDQLLRDNHHALPVLAADGCFEGVVSPSDLLRSGRSRVILVDHFERPQAVAGLASAEVLEILDHHRVGNIQTSGPIRVECRPVGSSCTIVASEYFDRGVEIDRGTATLLLGGIVADTLVLRGPTTTEPDRQIAGRLAKLAGVNLQEFGADVLSAGDDLLTSDPSKIWNRDQKQFSIRNQNFAVAQLETASLDRLSDEKLHAFRELVSADQKKNGLLLSLLVLTDVLKGDSWMVCCESKAAEGVIRSTFTGAEPKPNWIFAPGVVSRKKQIVPRVMQALAT